MGIKERLLNKIIYIDTAPFIYFIEGHSRYHETLLEMFELNAEGKVFFQTSTLTLLEVLVQPIKLQKLNLAKEYEKIITTSSNIEIFDIDIEISKKAAEIRAEFNFRTPDAIQIATGIIHGADFFFTNDLNLKKASGIEILILQELE
ncbi:MAG: type II toxin-antitoxin system VapC family toxin [Bacteroidales bacterium]